MASFSFVLDKYKKRDGKQSIKLQIIINRQVIPRNTGFSVLKKDWDTAKQRLKTSHPNHATINDALYAKLNATEREFAEVVKSGYAPTAKGIANKTTATHDFHEHAKNYIDGLTGQTELRTQQGLRSTANKIKEYSPTLAIEQIAPTLITGFRKWLERTPRSLVPGALPVNRTTINKRLSHFRLLYNLSPHKRTPSPFEEIVIGDSRPTKRDPLTEAEIKSLWDYEPKTYTERLAKDTFLFSYYAMGMRIGDVLLMKWDYLKDDRIRYDQTKKQHLDSDDTLDIPVGHQLKEIIGRWDRVSPYIFNSIKRPMDGRSIKDEVDKILSMTNPILKMIALRVGITKWISAKLARPTFADIANKKTNRNIYGIQQSMGHSRISTTEIYLGRDNRAIDEVAKATYGG